MRLHITVMQRNSFPFRVQSAIKIHSCFHLPLTCPCALVTSWPVTPWRLERALPKACELAMEPMAAAAAAAWLARGLLTSCKERKDQGENHHEAQEQHTDTTFTGDVVLVPIRSCKGPWTHWRGLVSNPAEALGWGEAGRKAGGKTFSTNTGCLVELIRGVWV